MIYPRKYHRTIPLMLLSICSAAPSIFAADNLQFTGGMLHPVVVTPEKSTGLDNIYVIYDTTGVDMEILTANSRDIKVYKYGNLGGAYAEQITDLSIESDRVILHDIEGDKGYIIEDADRRYYYWVVNYLPYRFQLRSATPSDMSDCDATVLDVDGFAPAIPYFTINGQRMVLSRDIIVSYNTQVWDENRMEWVEQPAEEDVAYFDANIRITPPALCYTPFHIKGDRFLEEWNWAVETETITATPSAVSVMTEAIQDGNSVTSSDAAADSSESDNDSDDSDASNVIKGDESSLGGSAPADIEFRAYVTQGVMHYEWQMSSDPEFENVDYRFNEQNLQYTFLEEGTYYLRFIGSNSDGSCEAIGDTYTVAIGSSELLCPNAFSPDGDGVNDIWKVSYRSLVEFDCWIFDRYGAQLYHFTDPSSGWDGKRGGKAVKPGVYYYVITAVGADGKKYKKSGDINILTRRSVDNGGSNMAE